MQLRSFRGFALSLLSSYLQNRKYGVEIDNYFSDEENVKFGVPQGSVLGPTVFFIYVGSSGFIPLDSDIMWAEIGSRAMKNTQGAVHWFLFKLQL